MRGFLNHASGDTDDSEDNASANEEELDFNIDFKLPEGVLRGLWLRTRAAFVDETARDAQDLIDYDLVVNYELPLL